MYPDCDEIMKLASGDPSGGAHRHRPGRGRRDNGGEAPGLSGIRRPVSSGIHSDAAGCRDSEKFSGTETIKSR